MCEGLGIVGLADDFGIGLRVRLHIDATAALGILQRQGVGRVRHLDVGVLWLEEQQLRRLVDLTKVSGTQNPADLMTKNLAKEHIDQYSEMLGFHFESGRSDATAKLHALAWSSTTLSAFAGCARWEAETLGRLPTIEVDDTIEDYDAQVALDEPDRRHAETQGQLDPTPCSLYSAGPSASER